MSKATNKWTTNPNGLSRPTIVRLGVVISFLTVYQLLWCDELSPLKGLLLWQLPTISPPITGRELDELSWRTTSPIVPFTRSWNGVCRSLIVDICRLSYTCATPRQMCDTGTPARIIDSSSNYPGSTGTSPVGSGSGRTSQARSTGPRRQRPAPAAL